MKQVSGDDRCSCGERCDGIEILAQHGGDVAHKNVTKHAAAYTVNIPRSAAINGFSPNASAF
jgi:hypothetical protein